MSAIITQRFRKNNVQNFFDEMTLPSVMLTSCSSTNVGIYATITASSGVIPANLQTGMAVLTSSGTGILSASNTTIVTSVSTNSFQIYPQPTVALAGNSVLSFYSQYYMGIGKSDAYNGGLDGTDLAPASPVASIKTEVDARNNLIALQKIVVALNTGSGVSQSAIFGNAGYVLPRYNWTTGNFYKAWDSSDPSCFYPTTITSGSTQFTAYPCYAVYNSGSGNKVYLCAASGYEGSVTSASSLAPSNTSNTLGTVGASGSDGYRWTYISDLGLDTAETLTAKGLTTSSGNTSSTLDSNQFFKIYRRSTTTGTSSTITTNKASAGSIYSCRVVSGGYGYAVGNAFSIDGDGSGATGSVSAVSAGAIQAVTIVATGSGYTTGAVRFTSGVGSSAIIVPRIAPANGFGYNVVEDLPAWYAGFYANFAYDAIYPGTADVPSTDQIRQITLLRNPIVFNSSAGSSITYRCLKSMVLNTSSTANLPTAGDVIEQTSGYGTGLTPRGYVDFVSTSGATTTVYYHQNSSTFGSAGLNLTPIPFTSASTNYYKIYRKPTYSTTATVSPSPAVAILTTASSEEYTAGSGEVLFIQNRTPITQAAGQTEAITIVTQF